AETDTKNASWWITYLRPRKPSQAVSARHQQGEAEKIQEPQERGPQMKTSKTKIKRLRATYSALRKLERSIFDGCATTLAELDRVSTHLERDLAKAQKSY